MELAHFAGPARIVARELAREPLERVAFQRLDEERYRRMRLVAPAQREPVALAAQRQELELEARRRGAHAEARVGAARGHGGGDREVGELLGAVAGDVGGAHA